MFFKKKVGGRCGCVYGTKGAVDRKSLGTTGLNYTGIYRKENQMSSQKQLFLLAVFQISQ
jgi:hypothetical protein